MLVDKSFISANSPYSKCLGILCVFLVSFSIIRVISTYPIFNATFDEPAHFSSGIEFLDRGSYMYGPDHPPLARLAVALGPYFAGTRLSILQKDRLDDWERNRADKVWWKQQFFAGTELLHKGNKYFRTLSLARLGILPFFIMTSIITWVWCRVLFGDSIAFLSIFFLSTCPSVIAHSGLATNDMVLTCCYLAGVFAFILWLQAPTYFRGMLFGATWGFAALSKFSALLFLPSSAAMIIFWSYLINRASGVNACCGGGYTRKMSTTLSITVLVAFLVVWSGYRFNMSPALSPEQRESWTIDRIVGARGMVHDLAYKVVETPVPLGEMISGIYTQKKQIEKGHSAYLLGDYSTHGWWYYFPTVIAIKTPLTFLLFVAIGFLALGRMALLNKEWKLLIPILCPATIMLVIMLANINIGSRYALVIYPFLAMIAGYGVIFLWRLQGKNLIVRSTVVLFLGWHVVSTTLAHPDYLAYFNEFATNSPERFVVDSDLDWGQDLYRLGDELKKRDIHEFALAYFGSEDPKLFDLPAFRLLNRHEQTTGWIAISISSLKDIHINIFKDIQWGTQHDGYAWLQEYKPVAKIGKSINLYYIQPK